MYNVILHDFSMRFAWTRYYSLNFFTRNGRVTERRHLHSLASSLFVSVTQELVSWIISDPSATCWYESWGPRTAHPVSPMGPQHWCTNRGYTALLTMLFCSPFQHTRTFLKSHQKEDSISRIVPEIFKCQHEDPKGIILCSNFSLLQSDVAITNMVICLPLTLGHLLLHEVQRGIF